MKVYLSGLLAPHLDDGKTYHNDTSWSLRSISIFNGIFYCWNRRTIKPAFTSPQELQRNDRYSWRRCSILSINQVEGPWFPVAILACWSRNYDPQGNCDYTSWRLSLLKNCWCTEQQLDSKTRSATRLVKEILNFFFLRSNNLPGMVNGMECYCGPGAPMRRVGVSFNYKL